jgi:hypothetical protein
MPFFDGRRSPADLVLAILAEAAQKRIPIAKTKLTKLLYLTDLESVRRSGAPVTDWTWRFHLFGPWAPELDPLLENLEKHGLLQATVFSTDIGEGSSYVPTDVRSDLTSLEASLQSDLSRVLTRWLEVPLPRILDYVYFDTEPMQKAERGDMLDWSVVPRSFTPTYRRPDSGASQKTRGELLAAFRQRLSALPVQQMKGGDFAPRYDEGFVNAIEALSSDDDA